MRIVNAAIAASCAAATAAASQLEAPGEPQGMGGTAMPGPGGQMPRAAPPLLSVGETIVLSIVIAIAALALFTAWSADGRGPHRHLRRLAALAVSFALAPPIVSAITIHGAALGELCIAALAVAAAGTARALAAEPRRSTKFAAILSSAVALLFTLWYAGMAANYMEDVREQYQSAFVIARIVLPAAIAAVLIAILIGLVRIRSSPASAKAEDHDPG